MGTNSLDCLASICAAAAKFAILTNWRGTNQTALDEFAYWTNLRLALIALDAAVRTGDPEIVLPLAA